MRPGFKGEEIAEAISDQTEGMRCLERRYREKAGEIDLIMEEGETLVFVEVKARFSAASGGRACRRLTAPSRKNREKRPAVSDEAWMARTAIRFDVVEINQDQILHIPNAFQPGGMMF